MNDTQSAPSDMEGFCIDSISAKINTIPDVEHLKTILARYSANHDEEGRFTSATGQLKNLKVRIGLDYLIISGSPARYCHTANAFPFGPAEMDAFVRQISGFLHVPDADLRSATTNKLDIALNVLTSHPPRTYFPLLLDMPRTRRMEAENTLYFINGTRTARIYDKVTEVRAKRLEACLSAEQQAADLLRIEFSTRAAKRDFGTPVTLGLLAAPSFWPEVRAFWNRHFRSITQDSGNHLSGRAGAFPSTASALLRHFAALGIEASGGKQMAMAEIRAHQNAGAIRPDQAARMREKVEALDGSGSSTLATELAAELNGGVQRVLNKDEARVLNKDEARVQAGIGLSGC